MKIIVVLSALALIVVGCAPKPGGTAAERQCGSGLAPDSAAYRQCVSDAEAAANETDPAALRAKVEADANAMRAEMNADANQMRAQMDADSNQTRAQMQQDMQNAQAPGSGCKTTRDANNNVSTMCP
jgi:hypothetical protein